MTRHFGIAAVQIQVVPWDSPATLDRMAELAASTKAMLPWVDMICFPELCPTGVCSFSPPPPGVGRYDTAQAIPGPMTARVSELARRHNGWLQPGSMFELGCHLIDAMVKVLGKPDKVTGFSRSTRPQQDNLADNQLAVFEYTESTAK